MSEERGVRDPLDARRILENPFYVLGLRPSATRQEIEREGQKLLGMIELGLQQAATYATPLGHEDRTADKVRLALAELRDPDKRIVHEIWAALEPAMAVALDDDDTSDLEQSYAMPDAFFRLGWSAK
jgi:hypothetical protein